MVSIIITDFKVLTLSKFVKAMWEESLRLICPCLRYNKFLESWVALNEDPCIAKKCKTSNCHNYGTEFHRKEKLTILKGIEID